MVKISLKTIGLKLRTSLLYRMLVYALITAIIEGPAIIVLYSLGYPNVLPASLVSLTVLNFFLWFLWSNAIGGPETAAPPGSLIYNPLFQLFAGVVGMFVMVTLMGETIVWLRQEISKSARAATGYSLWLR